MFCTSSRYLIAGSIVLLTIGCASAAPDPAPVPMVTGNGTDGCGPIVAAFLAAPDSTPVTKVAEPIKMNPAPIKRPIPAGVIGRNGKANVEVTVMVGVNGKPDMKTFTVVNTSHPWLANSVKSAIAKWTFTPAEVNGCKVPRAYKFGASMGG